MSRWMRTFSSSSHRGSIAVAQIRGMRASTVAALSAGVVVVGVVAATTVSVGSSADREPLAPIVVHAPDSGAPPAPAAPPASAAPTGVPMGVTPADGMPAPPPALGPGEPAGGPPDPTIWNDGTGNDGWTDSADDWDDSLDDWDDSVDDWDDD